MKIKDKQIFEAHFNCIGHFLVEAYENAPKVKRKKISILMKNLSEIYKYTNRLETKLIKQKYEKSL
jgi:hypothetical protein